MAAFIPSSKTYSLSPLINSSRVEKMEHNRYSAGQQLDLSGIDPGKAAQFSTILHRKRLSSVYLESKQQQLVKLKDSNQVTEIPSVQTEEVDQLRQENHRLSQRLKQAELLLDIQKEILQLLSAMLEATRSTTGG